MRYNAKGVIMGGVIMAGIITLSGCNAEQTSLEPTVPPLQPLPTVTHDYSAPPVNPDKYVQAPESQPLKPNDEPEEDDPRFDPHKHGNKNPASKTKCDWKAEFAKATSQAKGPSYTIKALPDPIAGLYFFHAQRIEIDNKVPCDLVQAVVWHEWGHWRQEVVYGTADKVDEQLAPYGGGEDTADCVSALKSERKGFKCPSKKAELAAQALIKGVLAPHTSR